MSRIEFEPWEPEESVGKLWHAFASRLDSDPVHDGARVLLSQVGGRLAVLFRGLGGDAAVDIKPVAEETSHHRLSFLRRLGTWAETAPRASFDGATLRLPESLAAFPDPRANAALYLWLAAAAVALRDQTPAKTDDPLQADLAAIATAKAMTAKALQIAPGYASLHSDLAEATLLFRRTPHLPPVEAAVEARVRAALGEDIALPPLPTKSPRGYRPFKPIPLWPDLRTLARSETTAVEARATEGPPEESEEKTARRARRRKADQADRTDSFILHKFEAILSMTEFLNLSCPRRWRASTCSTA
jgi:nitric oxide reductase NorD protein